MQTQRMTDRSFDREHGLRELLAGMDADRVLHALETLLGTRAQLLTPAHEPMLGEPHLSGSAPRATIRGELEAIGVLQADAPEAQLRAAADLLELLLHGARRYRMAADLHQESVQSDYEELQRRHAALRESEARYRELSATLEQRVTQQVGVIETAQRQLYQNEKLASVGRLAAGVAHEINNPIGFVQSNLNTALDYLGRIAAVLQQVRSGVSGAELESLWQRVNVDFVQADFVELLRESLSGVQRVARIVADLRGFARVDAAGAEDADINAVIRGVCNVADSQLRAHADVVLELGELPALHCHAGQVGQLLLNLLDNAAQAMRTRGTIRIATARVDNAVCIHVADDGAGMAPEVLPHVFEPFFTTRPVGQGTGLGLTVCNDIVRAHGGRIEVESTVGKGTEVTVWLPLQERCSAA